MDAQVNDDTQELRPDDYMGEALFDLRCAVARLRDAADREWASRPRAHKFIANSELAIEVLEAGVTAVHRAFGTATNVGLGQ